MWSTRRSATTAWTALPRVRPGRSTTGVWCGRRTPSKTSFPGKSFRSRKRSPTAVPLPRWKRSRTRSAPCWQRPMKAPEESRWRRLRLPSPRSTSTTVPSPRPPRSRAIFALPTRARTTTSATLSSTWATRCSRSLRGKASASFRPARMQTANRMRCGSIRWRAPGTESGRTQTTCRSRSSVTVRGSARTTCAT